MATWTAHSMLFPGVSQSTALKLSSQTSHSRRLHLLTSAQPLHSASVSSSFLSVRAGPPNGSPVPADTAARSNLTQTTPLTNHRPLQIVHINADQRAEEVPVQHDPEARAHESTGPQPLSEKAAERMRRRRSERSTYLIAAVASSVGVSFLASSAVVYRFVSQMQAGGEVPYLEIFGTLALAVGAAVGMEFWARWAHKALWHESLWHMHESHHRPREGPFELNDVFAIINAVPAIALLAYGFFSPGLVPGLCFGAGLGITVFGMAYMFVHDGLVHRRFPVGPIADVPYLQRVAAAHQLHHADKFQGVPFGLFLGEQELGEVGGLPDLEELLASRKAAAAAAAAITSAQSGR